ncbi:MAG: acyl-CoA desaturase [Chloroflexi bacterium]|nr:acyl-CoA desaturase [Chloroflexota bacterium]
MRRINPTRFCPTTVSTPNGRSQSRPQPPTVSINLEPINSALPVDQETHIATATQSQSKVASTDYGDLKKILGDAGLRAAQPRFYIFKAIFNALALTGVVVLALWSPHPAVLVLSAILFGLMLTQNGMLGHDVAHRQVFRKRRGVATAGWILGNLLMGISYTWWTRKHNLHHANPNHVTDDPDANYPILAMFPAQIEQRSKYLLPLIAFQHYLYPVWSMFVFVSMRVGSMEQLFARESMPLRIPQAIGIILHWVLVGLLLSQLGGWPQAITFLVISQLTFSLYNVSVFAPNHKGMAMMTDDEPLDFLRTQVLTARNVRGSWFVDFWYGGLNYQIEHHLFPTMPRNRLKDARPLVEKFCIERGVSYHETTVTESYREIFQHLKRTSAPIREGTVNTP